jgi:hypothetical protein
MEEKEVCDRVKKIVVAQLGVAPDGVTRPVQSGVYLEPDARRRIGLRRRLLHEPIEYESAGQGDDDRHYASDDERAHDEGPSAKTSQAHHHSTTITLPHFSVPVPVPGAPASKGEHSSPLRQSAFP